MDKKQPVDEQKKKREAELKAKMDAQDKQFLNKYKDGRSMDQGESTLMMVSKVAVVVALVGGAVYLYKNYKKWCKQRYQYSWINH